MKLLLREAITDFAKQEKQIFKAYNKSRNKVIDANIKDFSGNPVSKILGEIVNEAKIKIGSANKKEAKKIFQETIEEVEKKSGIADVVKLWEYENRKAFEKVPRKQSKLRELYEKSMKDFDLAYNKFVETTGAYKTGNEQNDKLVERTLKAGKKLKDRHFRGFEDELDSAYSQKIDKLGKKHISSWDENSREFLEQSYINMILKDHYKKLGVERYGVEGSLFDSLSSQIKSITFRK